MIQYAVAITLLVVAIFLLAKRFIRSKSQSNCKDDCSCH